jgi:hypothetical protein
MPKPFVVYKLTEDSKDYYFLSPENHYNGAVSTANTGVTVATATEAATFPVIPVANLLKSSVATRRRLTIRVGTKTRTVDFVIASDKVATFDALVAGNYTTFRGQAATIIGAAEPLSASYS